MAGLILKLAPNERVLINGVIMENGDRKTTLKIKTPDAAILRLRDALHPDDVATPVTRAYYSAQLVVAGSSQPDAGAQALRPQLAALRGVFERIAPDRIEAAEESLRRRNFYSVMRALKPLIDLEKDLLGESAGGRAKEASTAPADAAA